MTDYVHGEIEDSQTIAITFTFSVSADNEPIVSDPALGKAGSPLSKRIEAITGLGSDDRVPVISVGGRPGTAPTRCVAVKDRSPPDPVVLV
jgi:hypothetical protein